MPPAQNSVQPAREYLSEFGLDSDLLKYSGISRGPTTINCPEWLLLTVYDVILIEKRFLRYS